MRWHHIPLLSAWLIFSSGVLASTYDDVEKAALLLDGWQLEEAYELTQKLLWENSEDPQVWVMAARVQHARGEHLSALSLLSAAQKRGLPGLEGFGGLIAGPAKLMNSFQVIETAHFRIKYLNKDEIVATYAQEVLEQTYARVGKALDFFPAERDEKIVVEILPSTRALAEATGLRVSEIEASGTIAVCKFHRLMVVSPLAAVNGYAWADTLAHEFIHLVISKRTKNAIPIWLHEAIAKYFESLWNGAAGRALSPYGEKLLKEATEKRDWISFAQMHPSMAKLPTQKDAALAFAEVFTVVEFLEKRYGKGVIAKILRTVGEGKSLEASLKMITGLTIKSLESKWQRYLEKRKFQIRPGAAAKTIRFVTDQEATDSEAAEVMDSVPERKVHEHSRLGEMLEMREHFVAARIEYEKAYALGGKSYASLVYRLGKIYRKEGKHKSAEKIVEQGLLLHPDSTDLLILAGRIALDAQDEKKALAVYEEARYYNPFNPEIHSALIHLYGQKSRTQLVQQEKRFLELTSRRRTKSQFMLPKQPEGEAYISVITSSWSPFKLNGTVSYSAPVVDLPLSVGRHTLEYVNRAGQVGARVVEIKAGEKQIVFLE